MYKPLKNTIFPSNKIEVKKTPRQNTHQLQSLSAKKSVVNLVFFLVIFE